MYSVRLSVVVLASLTIFGPAVGQPSTSSWSGVPPQVIPQAYETGAPTFTTPTGSASFMGNTGATASGGGSGPTVSGPSVSGGGGSSFQNMMSQSYGQTGYDTALKIGNNPNALAGFGQLESGFNNVPTANGSSSATGPWQITNPTWNEYVNKFNLPYTAADRTNPQAQAVVANYIIKDYAAQVSSSTGSPATLQQTYGAYVFGPQAGKGLASSTDLNEPMSNYVSAQGLQNNNMTGWTVGQFQNRVTSKIGDVANQTVKA
jgi:hypothetical protein